MKVFFCVSTATQCSALLIGWLHCAFEYCAASEKMRQYITGWASFCCPLLPFFVLLFYFFFFNDYWVAGEISHCDVRLFTTEIHPGPLFEIFFEKQTPGLQLGFKSFLNLKFKRLNFKWNLIKFHVDHLGRWLKASNEWKMAICWKNVEKKKTFCWRSRRLAF